MVQPVIGFYVCSSKSVTSGTTVPFNVIKTNLGNGWSSSNHRFTAPVKGLYYFTLGIISKFSSSPGTGGAWIMHGDVHLRFVYASRSSHIQAHITGSGSAVVMLNAGEPVWAKRWGGFLYSDHNLYTHFVGFLIQKVN